MISARFRSAFSFPGKTVLLAGALLLGGQVAAHAARVKVKLTSDGKGTLSAPAYSAKGNELVLSLGFAPVTGQAITVVKNTGISFISGKFSNLAQGQSLKLAFNGREYPFIADYYGGTGNDLVLHWGYRGLQAWGGNEAGQLGVEEQFSIGRNLPAEVISAGALAGRKVLRIACGGNHSIALCSDGTLVTWGENSSGQLGDGTLVKRYLPGVVPRTGALAGKFPVAVTAGMAHTVVLCSDGSLVAWGRNASGQLGNGTFVDSRTPVTVTGKVLEGATLVAVSAGNYFTLALRSDGQVMAWGDNAAGTLGNGKNLKSAKPVKVNRKGVLAKRSVVSLAAGGAHALAICSDGAVVSWGSGGRGQLGNRTRANSNVPVIVKESGILSKKNATLVTAGASHSLILYSDWTASAWGANESGQLGDNTTTDRLVPVAVPSAGALAGKKVIAVSTGALHTLALREDRVPLAWGNNIAGQLGIGNNDNSPVPAAVPMTDALLGTRFVTLAAGGRHSMGVNALPLSGDAVLTGLALDKGVMNLDFSTGRHDYVASVSTKENLTVMVKPTARHPLARVTVNGVAHVPGSAGVPVKFTTVDMLITVRVTAENGTVSDYRINLKPSKTERVPFQQQGAVGMTREAYDATGLKVNVGLDFAPSTGTSLMVLNNTGLNPIRGNFTGFGQGDTVVLNTMGRDYHFIVNYHGGDGNDLVLEWKRRTLAAWGTNSVGQLGNGSQTSIPLPAPVPVDETGVLAGKVVLGISSGASHTVALCSDGTLVAWGGNSQGQLGDGSVFNRTSPVAVDMSGVLAGKTVIAVEAALSRTRVLCSDGTLAAWGDGVATPALVVPSGELVGRKVVAFWTMGSSGFAVCSDGTLVQNPFGIPGLADQSGALVGKVVNRMAIGSSHFLALCSDGSLVAWGYNQNGQLGVGTGPGPGPLSPVLVDRSGILGGKTVVSVAASLDRSFAVCSDGTVASWGTGRLGNASVSASSTPVPVAGTGPTGGKPVISVTLGNGHTLLACADGNLLAFGSNAQGQLGTGATSSQQNLAVTVPRTGFLSATAALQSGANSTSSITLFATPADSTLSSLEVAGASLSSPFSPETTGYSLSFPASTQTLTITPTSRYPWSSILVDGVPVASGTSSVPIQIGSRPFIDVVVTGEDLGKTTYRLDMPGNVTAFFGSAGHVPVTSTAYVATGWSVSLDLGFTPPTGTSLMVVRNTGADFISGEFSNLTQGQVVSLTHNGTTRRFIANYYGGSGNDLVLEWADRKVSTWGLNTGGQLGNNSTTSSPVPVAVDDSGVLAGKTVVSLSGGAGQTVVLCVDGTVATWGRGNSGQLGAGESVTQSLVPVDVTGTGALAGKRVVAIATANGNTLALCSDGTMASWGYGNHGQLGNGSITSSFVPVAVDHSGALAGKKVVAVSMGGLHCLALCSDGTLVTWGSNSRGQLGNNSTSIQSLVPVAVNHSGVLAGKKATAITAGLEHCAALCSDGTLVAWGDNSSGQLGSASVSNPKVPVLIPKAGALVGKTVVALSQGGNDFVVGLCSDGTLVAWGGNANGQLGTGSFSSPSVQAAAVQLSGDLAGKTITSVGSGYKMSVATCSDGTVISWGYNPDGQLGTGGIGDSSRPMLVISSGVLAGHKGLNVAGAFHGMVVSGIDVPAGVSPSSASAPMERFMTSESSVSQTDSSRPGTSTVAPEKLPVEGIFPPGVLREADPAVRHSRSNGARQASWFFHEYRRKAPAGPSTVETFEYTTDLIFWRELEIFPNPGPGVELEAVDEDGGQTVRIRIPVAPGTQVIGRPKVSEP